MRIYGRYIITDEIRKEYNADKYIASDGYIYCKIKRGMYGLKQAARLAYGLIKQRLENRMDTSRIQSALICGAILIE